jgi:hypothetical protein
MYQARPTRRVTAAVTPIPMPTIAPVDRPSLVDRSAAGGLDPVVEPGASPLLVVTDGEPDNSVEVNVEDVVLLLVSAAMALVMLKMLVAESVETVFSSQTPIANI